MFTFEIIPRPLRQLVAEGLGRLIHHLARLAEDVRHGLVAAVSRAVGESVESAMQSVIRGRPRQMASPLNREMFVEREELPPSTVGGAETTTWPDPSDEPSDDEVVHDHRFESDSESLPEVWRTVASPLPPLRSFSPWRLVVATGLSGLATWLGSAGLTPLATAASVVAGAILLFLG